jgi:glycosyltransferase involved in cell wall biosynthesis
MYKGFSVGVVIPAYNEEQNIAKVLATIPSYVDLVVVVDDHSQDMTAEIAESWLDRRVSVIRRARNEGVGGSILTGHKASKADIDVVMAGDGQMNPLYLPRLLDAIVDGADYAKGNRFKSVNGMPRNRVFGNLVLSLLTKLVSGYWRISDSQNGYTALRMSTFKRTDVPHLGNGYQFENDMLIHLNIIGAKVVDVPMPSEYHGEVSRLRVRTFLPHTVAFLGSRFLWRLKCRTLRLQL